MKIYGMSDLHLGVRNNRVNTIFENNFETCVKNIYERSSENSKNIVLLAGDVFDYQIVRNEVLKNFLKIVSKYKDRVKFIISAGNHDSSPIREDSTLDILSNLNIMDNASDAETETSELFVYQSYDDMPTISVAVSKLKRFILEEEKIIIDALPFYMNKVKIIYDKEQRKLFNRDESYQNILVCHGVTDQSDIYDENEIINKFHTKKRDFILKGHIHQVFRDIVNKSPLYSVGSLNKNSSKSNGCYIEIYDDQRKIKINDEVIELDIDKLDTEVSTDSQETSFVEEIIDTPEQFTVNYKFFDCEKEETINETLKTLTSNDIVSIKYFGNTEAINSEEYLRCFNECVKFSFIFSDIDLDVSDYTRQNINSLEFIGFHDFMTETLGKMREDSDIDSIEKIYNKLKKRLYKKGKLNNGKD